MYGLDLDQDRPDDTDWTGAEIKACARLSVLLDLPLTEAAKNVVPVAVTAAESIGNLRQWATGRCLDATGGGVFQHKKSRKRRKLSTVGPAPSVN